MLTKNEETTLMHPIGVVARRTGLSHDVLRVWEKRHGVVCPKRSGTRRLYSDEDIERLSLLRRVTEAGHPIGHVARLGPTDLLRLLEQDKQAHRQEPRAGLTKVAELESDSDPSFQVEACLDAVRRLDSAGLERALERSTLVMSRVAVIDKVVVPLMHEVGRLWHADELRIANEHMASAVIRSFLGVIVGVTSGDGAVPELVVGTPAGQLHELGALVVVAAAVTEGWKVTYLGPNLPAEELAAGVQQSRARALGLSITFPTDDPRLADELLRLRELVGDRVTLLVGGVAAESYADALREVDAVRPGDLGSLRTVLSELRRSGRSYSH